MFEDLDQALKIVKAAINYTTDRASTGRENKRLYENLEDAVFMGNPAAVESLARKRKS